MRYLLISLVIQAQVSAAVPADSVEELRRQARRAEARFERLSRQLAPVTWQTYGGGTACDEVVGRFCLHFDSTSSPPARPEAGQVAHARADAVETVRRWFSAAPHDAAAAGPLVRLLIVDGRAGEAVSAARAFMALTTDSLQAELLLGTALHAAGADSAAEHRFARALARMAPDRRREWLDPHWLLDRDARSAAAQLAPDARAEHERRFWLLSDPFWVTAPNEYWAEHIARQVHARLLADVPVVAGGLRWGRDLDELTVRYGVPTRRTRADRAIGTPVMARSNVVEHWDSAQRAFTPARLAGDVPEAPEPGARPRLYAGRARTGYSYGPVTRVLELPHQATRFLHGGRVVLRVDGRLAAETAPAAAGSPGGQSDAARQPPRPTPVSVLAYDSAFATLHRVDGVAAWRGDDAVFTLTLSLPPERVVYSVEALDTAADIAARARFGLDATTRATGPALSDVLVSSAFAPGPLPQQFDSPLLRARSTLVISRGDTLGVYAEAYRFTGPVEVELAVQSGSEPSLLGRAGRWLGRALGIGGPAARPRLAWRAVVEHDTHAIALNLPLDARLTGLNVLVLRITDLRTGAVAVTHRDVLIR